MNSNKSVAEQRHRTHRLAIIVGGVIPVLIALAGTGIMLSWLPELPDTVAIHWSGTEPDGFGPAWSLVVLPVGIVLAFSAFAIGAAWSTTPAGLLVRNQKFVLVTGIWLSALLTVGITASLDLQRGLSDAANAGSGDGVGRGLLLGAALGFALAVPAWFLLPRTDVALSLENDPAPIEIAASERVTWSRGTRLGGGPLAVVVGALTLALASTVLTGIRASEGFGFAVSALVMVILLTLTTTWWRVTVDRRGLRVRSALGWPRVRIPIDEIRGVSSVIVNPRAEFGGWGWRWDGTGRSGIILRGGEAIQVTRASGKKFVVTVDDAETGAAVLAALLQPQPELQ